MQPPCSFSSTGQPPHFIPEVGSGTPKVPQLRDTRMGRRASILLIPRPVLALLSLAFSRLCQHPQPSEMFQLGIRPSSTGEGLSPWEGLFSKDLPSSIDPALGVSASGKPRLSSGYCGHRSAQNCYHRFNHCPEAKSSLSQLTTGGQRLKLGIFFWATFLKSKD